MKETKILDLSQFESPNNDTPNVKKLWSPKILQPEQEKANFDIKEFVSEKKLEDLKIILEELWTNNRIKNYLQLAKAIKIIHPDIEDKIDLTYNSIKEAIGGISGNISERINGTIKVYKSLYMSYRNKPWDFFRLVLAIKSICPDFPNTELSAGIERFGGWEKILERLNILRNKDGEVFLKTAIPAKILNPQINFAISSKVIHKMENKLKEYREFDNVVWLAKYSNLAANLKISNPQVLKVDKETWDAIKKALNEDVPGSRYAYTLDYAELAMNAKILAAEEVKITDKGLKINMKKNKPFIKIVSPLPARLKFK